MNTQPAAAGAGHTEKQGTAGLALLALGVVYGDIGTSPLYAAKEVFNPAHGIAFSADKEQRFMYVVDLSNAVVWILDRAKLEVLGSFGRMGQYAGMFMRPHNIASDSKGNLYVTEATGGRRVQKFDFRGVR